MITVQDEIYIGTAAPASGSGGSGRVDSELNQTSENPVQNKVITAAISDLSAQTNMDEYLDLIITGNTQDLPITTAGQYDTDLTDIIGGTYDNNV